MEDRIKDLKNRFVSLVESQIGGNLSTVDAKELGEVMDMAKDCAELMKSCAEAEYYEKITKAMDKNSSETNAMYMDKYLPESRYYTPMWDARNDGRYDDKYRSRMYYTSVDDDSRHRMTDGRSYISRRGYMEAKDKETKDEELENYIKDLAEDISEMMTSLDQTEKTLLKQKIAQLANKL